MDFDSFRPIISGAIGAAASLWLVRRWAKTLPLVYESKSIAQIAAENRLSVHTGNALFLVSLAIGICMYKFGGYDSRDLFPLAVAFGLAGTLPLLGIPLVATLANRSPKEAFVAFSIGQGVPMWATYGALGLFVFIAICGAVDTLVR